MTHLIAALAGVAAWGAARAALGWAAARRAAGRAAGRAAPTPRRVMLAHAIQRLGRVVGRGMGTRGEVMMTGLQARLRRAGLRDEQGQGSPEAFLGSRLIAALAGAVVLPALLDGGAAHAVAGGALGWFLPGLWLSSRAAARQTALSRGLPDALDLLGLAVEAGVDFAQAAGRVAAAGIGGPVAAELDRLQDDLRMGRTRQEALAAMATRADHPGLSRLVAAVSQNLRLGAPLGPVLRAQADQAREDRVQAAEKTAAEAPVKMLFPLILFIFPATFIILFGPLLLMFLGR